MTSTMKACIPSGIYKLFPCGWTGLSKICKTPMSFFKKMAVKLLCQSRVQYF